MARRKKFEVDRSLWEQAPALFQKPDLAAGSDADDHNYTWLLRSTGEQATEARRRLETWFRGFPEDTNDKWELFRRFSNDDELQHVGAFWELYCCSLLQRHGFDVEVHPEAREEKSTHPDFRASRGGDAVLDLECRLLRGPMLDVAEQARMRDFMAALQKRVTSPRFWVHVHYSVRGRNAPSVKKIAGGIQGRLDQAGADPPVDFELTSNGWHFDIHAYSKNGAEVEDDRAIAGSDWTDAGTAPGFVASIKDKLGEKKAGRYGIEKVPYVIALNSRTIIDDEWVEYALYGGLTVIPNIGLRKREKDGFFSTENTHVSGVLWVHDLMPTNTDEKKPVLWHNPNAKNPIASEDWPGPQVCYSPDQDAVVSAPMASP